MHPFERLIQFIPQSDKTCGDITEVSEENPDITVQSSASAETMILIRDELTENENITVALLVLEDRADTETMPSLNAEV